MLPSRTNRNQRSPLVIILILLVLVPVLFSLQKQSPQNGNPFSSSFSVSEQMTPAQVQRWQRDEGERRRATFLQNRDVIQ